MAMHGPSRHTPGYTPFRKSGWGAAAFISALAVACFIGAFLVHNATYNDPIDPLSPSKGREAAHHGPADAHADDSHAADSHGASAGH